MLQGSCSDCLVDTLKHLEVGFFKSQRIYVTRTPKRGKEKGVTCSERSVLGLSISQGSGQCFREQTMLEYIMKNRKMDDSVMKYKSGVDLDPPPLKRRRTQQEQVEDALEESEQEEENMKRLSDKLFEKETDPEEEIENASTEEDLPNPEGAKITKHKSGLKFVQRCIKRCVICLSLFKKMKRSIANSTVLKDPIIQGSISLEDDEVTDIGSASKKVRTVYSDSVSLGLQSVPRNTIENGTANHIVINNGTGGLSSEAVLSTSRGGFGQAMNAVSGFPRFSGGAVTSVGLIQNSDIAPTAAIVDTKLATISTSGKVSNSATSATTNATNSTIILRGTTGYTSIRGVNFETSGGTAAPLDFF